MATFQFRQVDVFTDRPLSGNPLAVVLDADGMSAATMQAVAAETNLSETAFVMAPGEPDADYRIRIFTPRRELPFAGHPSVGTAFALEREGRFGEPGARRAVRQQVEIGVLPIEIQPAPGGPVVTMTQGQPDVGEQVWDLGGVADALGCRPERLPACGPGPRIASTGLPQLMVPTADAATLSSLRPDPVRLAALERRLGVTGIYAFALGPGATARARFFSPGSGIAEDPATGSAAGALGATLAAEGLLGAGDAEAALVVSQGEEIGRPSRIEVGVRTEAGVPVAVRVGGRCVTVLEGALSIPRG